MDTTPYKYEIIAVDDYSTDGTRELLRDIDGISVVEHPYNKGYGNSLKTGIVNARYNTIVMLDSDGTYLPAEIPKLLRYADRYDLVSGARVGRNVKIPLLRRPAKFILTMLANVLTGMKIPDINCGLRVMKKDNVQKFFYLLPPRFSFTITHLLACLSNDYNVKFVPINYHARKDKSTIHPIKDFIRFLNIIVRIVTYFKPFKMFSFFSVFMMLIAFIVWIYTFLVIGRIADITVLILALSSIQIFLFGLLADIVIKASNKN
jgi:glycosyltransferase involved in cell wall biosynthesis